MSAAASLPSPAGIVVASTSGTSSSEVASCAAEDVHAMSERYLAQLPSRNILPMSVRQKAPSTRCEFCGEVFSRARDLQRHFKSNSCKPGKPLRRRYHREKHEEKEKEKEKKPFVLVAELKCLRCRKKFTVEVVDTDPWFISPLPQLCNKCRTEQTI